MKGPAIFWMAGLFCFRAGNVQLRCIPKVVATPRKNRSQWGLFLRAADKERREWSGNAAKRDLLCFNRNLPCPNEKRAFFAEGSFLTGVPVRAGSSTWARTRDLRINSPALYQLSYRGMRGLDCINKLTQKTPLLQQRLEFLAPRPGLEPGTYGLTVRRSTN